MSSGRASRVWASRPRRGRGRLGTDATGNDASVGEADQVIAQGTVFKGDLAFKTLCRIDGRFEGTLQSEGTLQVSITGCVVGDVRGLSHVQIAGRVEGNVVASSVQLTKDATVTGDVLCARLDMSPGATVQGNASINLTQKTARSPKRQPRWRTQAGAVGFLPTPASTRTTALSPMGFADCSASTSGSDSQNSSSNTERQRAPTSTVGVFLKAGRLSGSGHHSGGASPPSTGTTGSHTSSGGQNKGNSPTGSDARSSGSTSSSQEGGRASTALSMPHSAVSITPAFTSVALLLTFDHDKAFEGHLESEHSAENVWFWRRGMQYRSTAFSTQEEQLDCARGIFKDFVDPLAEDPVNIPGTMIETIRKAIAQGAEKGARLSHRLFDPALGEVEAVMVQGAFPRFQAQSLKPAKDSWQKMMAGGLDLAQAGEVLFGHMFDLCPDVQPMFHGTARQHGQTVMCMLDNCARGLLDLSLLYAVLVGVGIRHRRLKVERQHFALMGQALILTLQQFMGKNFTPEVEQSWNIAYGLMANIMTNMMDPPSEDTPSEESHEAEGLKPNSPVESPSKGPVPEQLAELQIPQYTSASHDPPTKAAALTATTPLTERISVSPTGSSNPDDAQMDVEGGDKGPKGAIEEAQPERFLVAGMDITGLFGTPVEICHGENGKPADCWVRAARKRAGIALPWD